MHPHQLASLSTALLVATLSVLACSSGETETVTTVDVSGLRNPGAATGGSATTAGALTASERADDALDDNGEGGTAFGP